MNVSDLWKLEKLSEKRSHTQQVPVIFNIYRFLMIAITVGLTELVGGRWFSTSKIVYL